MTALALTWFAFAFGCFLSRTGCGVAWRLQTTLLHDPHKLAPDSFAWYVAFIRDCLESFSHASGISFCWLRRCVSLRRAASGGGMVACPKRFWFLLCR
jgi:hypothetical protein